MHQKLSTSIAHLHFELSWDYVLQLALYKGVEHTPRCSLPVHEPGLAQVASHTIELKLGSIDLHRNICTRKDN